MGLAFSVIILIIVYSFLLMIPGIGWAFALIPTFKIFKELVIEPDLIYNPFKEDKDKNSSTTED